MSRGWNGYLVRALNEFASLTAQCGSENTSRPLPLQTKTSIQPRIRRRAKKSSGTARRRRSR